MSAFAAATGLRQSFVEDRALLWGVLASIALHALVLLGMSLAPAPEPPAKTLLVLTARLVPLVAAPQAPVQPPPHMPAPAARKPIAAPHPVPAKPEPAPRPAAAQQSTASAEAPRDPSPEPATAPPTSAPSSDQRAGPVQAKVAPQVPDGTAAGAGSKSGNEADAGTLEQYRLALIVAARRYKRYPAIAMEKGWQGRVEVHIDIGANGMIASTSIKASSGHELLDNQALDMLKKGKTTVPIPPNLRGREFSIDIPVIFNLENPNS